MRILVAGSHYADSFARNIAETLERMGHVVLAVEDASTFWHFTGWKKTWRILERAFPSIERKHQRGMVRAIEAFQPNLVVITYGQYSPQIIHEMRHASRLSWLRGIRMPSRIWGDSISWRANWMRGFSKTGIWWRSFGRTWN